MDASDTNDMANVSLFSANAYRNMNKKACMWMKIASNKN